MPTNAALINRTTLQPNPLCAFVASCETNLPAREVSPGDAGAYLAHRFKRRGAMGPSLRWGDDGFGKAFGINADTMRPHASRY
jgi:hypothetical protein